MARRAEKNDDLDALFQLPLDEFTAARNALAKQAGKDGAAIRELSKPPVAAWAVNQLYWRDRDTYEALIERSEQLRAAHKAVLAGRAADLRTAGRAHDQALDAALKRTMALLTEAGHPASDTTRQAIVSTLRALPGDEPPGRLTRTLQPGGFEALAGFPIAKGAGLRAVPAPKPAKKTKQDARPAAEREPQVDRKAVAAATEALRRAETAARREEFERARTAREADKAATAVERARQALERAQEELEEAQEAANAAAENRARAERRAAESEAAVAAARAALDRAREPTDL